jgi:hypothetical protein
MAERNAAYVADAPLAEQDAKLFRRAVSNALRVFGQDAFRKPVEDGRRSAPYADAILYALSYVDLDASAPSVSQDIKKALRDLYSMDDAYRAAILTGTNGETAINTRLAKARRVVHGLPGVKVLPIPKVSALEASPGRRSPAAKGGRRQRKLS